MLTEFAGFNGDTDWLEYQGSAGKGHLRRNLGEKSPVLVTSKGNFLHMVDESKTEVLYTSSWTSGTSVNMGKLMMSMMYVPSRI